MRRWLADLCARAAVTLLRVAEWLDPLDLPDGLSLDFVQPVRRNEVRRRIGLALAPRRDQLKPALRRHRFERRLRIALGEDALLAHPVRRGL